MSYEPSQEDIYRADPYLAVQDMKAQLAAEKKDFDSLSDPELNKLADDYRVDVSQMQSQYTGIPGLGGKRIAQKTFAQLVRGDREQKPRSTAPLGPSVRAAPMPPPAAFESDDFQTLLNEKLAEMDLQREQVVVPDAVPRVPDDVPRPRVKPAVPPAPEAVPKRFGVTPVTAGSESLFPPSVRQEAAKSGRAIAERSTNFVERIKNFLDNKKTSVVDTPPSMSSEEKEMLREALGAGEEISESLIERVGNLFTNLLPERKPLSGSAPIIEQGIEDFAPEVPGEKYRERLQTEMARMRTPKEIEGTGLTSPEQTNVVDRDEFNTTPIGTRLRLLAEENLRRNQEAREAIKKEEGTPPTAKRPVASRGLDSAAKRFEATIEAPRQEQKAIVSKEESREERQRRIEKDIAAGRSSPIVRLSGKKQEGTPPIVKRPVAPRVLDSAAKRFEATLEAPRQEQEGTRLSFADIVEKRTRNAPKTGAAIANNEAQVGKPGSASRASQTNIIKDYLNSMGYSKQDQTKFAKYFFDTFDQDVFFNQDVLIAALKMFNKEN